MSSIEKRVMGSVAAIYAFRLLTSITALKVYAIAVSALGIALFVSVPNVFLNFFQVAQGGPASIWVFVVSAVLGTTLLVQLALVFGAAASISLLRDFIRTQSLRSYAA